MTLMNGFQYINSLKKLNTKVYLFGKEEANWVEHPVIRPSVNCMAMTYELAHDPELEDLMTANSSITGERINRFTHIHRSAVDLAKKVRMLRLLGQKTASCFQRCSGMDAMNAVYSTTFEVDRKYGTDYHERFTKYTQYVQQNDLAVHCAMTDPKGDRGAPPGRQKDPDLYLHIMEKRTDGIIVRGAKAQQGGSIMSHENLILTTTAMGESDKQYAVVFAVPSDAEGLFMICDRQPCDTRKTEPNADIDLGNKYYESLGSLIIFDDVFIPDDRIFLCEEYDFTGTLIERFTGYHRQSYGGCKSGAGDVIIGAAALAAEYGGVHTAAHIREKLVEMTHLNETLYSCGIASAVEGYPTEAGNYQNDLLLANVCKLNITRFPEEIIRLAEDIAGGLMVTMPSERDFRSDLIVGRTGMTIGNFCSKYFAGVSGISAESRMRILRFLENICLGPGAVGYRTESIHGGGSPQAQRIMIGRLGNIDRKKELAKEIAGIADAGNSV